MEGVAPSPFGRGGGPSGALWHATNTNVDGAGARSSILLIIGRGWQPQFELLDYSHFSSEAAQDPSHHEATAGRSCEASLHPLKVELHLAILRNVPAL